MAEYTPSHSDFAEAFRTGARFALPFAKIEMRTQALGELEVSSGQLVACDPLSAFQLEPFVQAVPNGKHRVQLAIAKLDNGDQRVAAARVIFRFGTPTRWTLATIAGENVAELQEGSTFGYGVDSGTGCFVDAAVAAGLPDPEVQKAISAQLEETYVHTWSCAGVPLQGGNVVAFSSGFGDGSYSSYWGFGAGGELLMLVTDFGVLVESVSDDVFIERAPGQPLGPIATPALEKYGIRVARIEMPADVEVVEGEAGGPVFELATPRAVEVELVDPKGERVPVPASTLHEGERQIVAFPKELPADARLKISVPLGLKPLPSLR